MATLRRNNFGYYFLEARIDGRRIRKTLKTRYKKIAEARANIFLRDLTGESQTVSRITFEAFKLEYIEYAKTRKAEGTVEGERIVLEKFSSVCPENRRLDSITGRVADRFITVLSNETIAKDPDQKRTRRPASVNVYIRTLRSIFSVAVKWGHLKVNPFSQVKVLRVETELPRILTLEEINLFFSKAREMSPDLVPLYEFYILTGVRRAEALRLEWKDLNINRGSIVLRNTKSKRPRFVKMSPRVKTLLTERAHLLRPFDFQSDWVSHRFVAIAVAAGIRGVSLHDLRRSFASYAADSGMPMLFIPWMMGHQSIDVTTDHYAGFDDAMMDRYMVGLERKIFPN